MPLDIAKWLADIDLAQYADIDFDILQDLTDADFEKLGVLSMGHRKRLLRAAQVLSAPQESPTQGPTQGGTHFLDQKSTTGCRAYRSA